MRIRKSVYNDTMFGFFSEDEFGHPEEFMTVKSLKKVKEMVKQLQKDIDALEVQNGTRGE